MVTAAKYNLLRRFPNDHLKHAVITTDARLLCTLCRFPGTYAAYDNAITSAVDSRMLMEAAIHTSTEPKAANQHFNIHNGDTFRWSQVGSDAHAYRHACCMTCLYHKRGAQHNPAACKTHACADLRVLHCASHTFHLTIQAICIPGNLQQVCALKAAARVQCSSCSCVGGAE